MEIGTLGKMEHAEEAFRTWRLQKKFRSERIPDTLWALAVALVGSFNLTTVCKRLRLGPRELKAKTRTTQPKRDTPLKSARKVVHARSVQEPITFLSTELGSLEPKARGVDLKISLKKGNGDQLEIAGASLEGHDLTQMISAFLGA